MNGLYPGQVTHPGPGFDWLYLNEGAKVRARLYVMIEHRNHQFCTVQPVKYIAIFSFFWIDRLFSG